MKEVFHCRICEKDFDEIPADAVRLDRRRSPYKLYRFSNGLVHDIRRILVGPPKNELIAKIITLEPSVVEPAVVEPVQEVVAEGEVQKATSFAEHPIDVTPDEENEFYEHVALEGDRLHGRVRLMLPDRHGYIDGDDGTSYLVFLSEVRPDAYGRQFLEPDEEASFVPFLSTKGKPEARDVFPFGWREEVFDSTYRDDAVITKLFPSGAGYAERSTGETVHIYQGDVITHGMFVVGAKIRFRPRRPKPGRKMFEAKSIEIYRVGETEAEGELNVTAEY
jgi:hypothetical protein